MKGNESTITPKTTHVQRTIEELMDAAEEGDKHAIQELRQRAPAMMQRYGNLAAWNRKSWCERLSSSPLVQAAVSDDLKRLEASLNASGSHSPLETLLIDQVVLSYLHVQFADGKQRAFYQNGGGSLAQGTYYQQQWERAQRAYLGAITSLARVRRLLNPTIVQVNVADKQVNIASAAS